MCILASRQNLLFTTDRLMRMTADGSVHSVQLGVKDSSDRGLNVQQTTTVMSDKYN